MDPERRGDITEERAFRALSELKDMHGDFVLLFRRSSPAVDVRGIDALVEIRLPKGSRKNEMTVPLEFKSSMWGVAKWKVVHSDLHKAGVLIFFFPLDMSPRKARRLIYRALTRVSIHSRGGTLYHSMFQRLFKGGSRNLRRNVHLIREKRARDKNRRR